MDESAASDEVNAQILRMIELDMRTGLNGVIGMADLLIGSELGPEQREFAQTVRLCGEDVLALVDDALAYNRFRQGLLQPRPQPTRLRQLIHACKEQTRLRTVQGRIDLCLDALPLEQEVELDPALFGRLMAFLLRRAVGQAGDRGVALKVALCGGPCRLQLRIEAGAHFIDEMKTLMDLQAHQALQRLLAQAMIDMLGVQLHCDDMAVEVSVPCRLLGESDAPSQASMERPDRMRVLVVDDDKVNQRLLQHEFQKLDCVVKTAADGRAALAALGQRRYDMMLMDVHLPVLDGVEATRLLREAEAADRLEPLPVIGMTASTDIAIRDRCLAAGMQELLVKPLRREQLEALLRRWSTTTDSQIDTQELLADIADGPIDEQAFAEQIAPIIADSPGLIVESLQEMRAAVDALREAITAGERSQLGRCAHSLISSAGSLHAVELAELARRIEERSRAGEDAVIECARFNAVADTAIAALRDRLPPGA